MITITAIIISVLLATLGALRFFRRGKPRRMDEPAIATHSSMVAYRSRRHGWRNGILVGHFNHEYAYVHLFDHPEGVVVRRKLAALHKIST